MGFELVHFSDCGAFRSCNQDAYCVRITAAECGTVAFAAVCDGMGGLKCGEIASAAVIHAVSQWLEQAFFDLAHMNFNAEMLFRSWNHVIKNVHQELRCYAEDQQIALGTTLSLLLMTETRYYIAQVGDSRIYLDDGSSVCRITQDQTLAVREYLSGRIGESEFAAHPGHHVLLQCIGTKEVAPVFSCGILPKTGAVLLCSDGFYHFVDETDLHAALNTETGRETLNANILKLGEHARACGEKDNMTAVVLRWDGFDDMPGNTALLEPDTGDSEAYETYVSVTYTNAPPIDQLHAR